MAKKKKSETHDRVLLAIVRGLIEEPAYLLVFAICFLIVGGGGAAGIITLFSKTSNAALSLAALGAIILPMLALVALVTRKFWSPAHQSSESLAEREHIQQAMKAFQSLLSQPFLKRDLSFYLHIRPDSVDEHSAMMDLHGSYVVRSIVQDDEEVSFVSQIEVSEFEERDTITGHLTVTDSLSGRTVLNKQISLSREDRENRPLERVFQTSITLPAKAEYRFTWKTEPYRIDLPHTEFWATAHPVFGMQITIRYDKSQLVVRGDCYRRVAADVPLVPVNEEGQYGFKADGLFLPYQGIFVRIIKMDRHVGRETVDAERTAGKKGARV